ncbi:hypothetical protein [Carnobacterium maltaromaticum]|uniref:hypothetical protein n=1 Tax=Carnobacterium maltaromaticum TaxID=2751 RepID=UPI0021525291|nr:hypothetical protein [Carnobacterium maltaromaticum]
MKTPRKGQRLWMKLTLMVLMTVIVTLITSYILLNQQITKSVKKNEEIHLLKVARTISEYPLVHQSLEQKRLLLSYKNTPIK